jgi:8-oxo-dGTP diphosphatase
MTYLCYALVLLVNSSNQALLLLRSHDSSFGPNQYCIVGGSIEQNENPTDCAIREVYEELGITLKPDNLDFICVTYKKKSSDVMLIAFTFKATQWQGIPVNKEPDKHSSFGWFNLANLPKNTLATHKKVIGKYLQGEKYLEDGF